MDEARIWKLIQQRDEAAFEAYYKQNYQAFCLVAYRYLQDRESARQVVNDVFLSLWTQAELINIETSLRAYIYRSITNRSLNLLKQKRRPLRDLEKVADLADPSVVSARMEENELRARLYEAIDRLPGQCGKVFRMSRFEHMKRQEIADKLGISIKTVQHHIARALKDLHQVWNNYILFWIWLFTELFFRGA